MLNYYTYICFNVEVLGVKPSGMHSEAHLEVSSQPGVDETIYYCAEVVFSWPY